MAKKEKNKTVWIASIVILVIILLLFVPNLIENKKELEYLKHKGELIQQGKSVSDTEIIGKVIDILKIRDKGELNRYLSNDFEYWRERKRTVDNLFLE